MRHLTLIAVMLLALSTATERAIAQEWKEVEAAEAKIVLMAPQLNDVFPRFRRTTTSDKRGQMEEGFWLGNDNQSGAFTLALLTFSGSVIRKEIKYKPIVSDSWLLKDAPIKWGRDGKTRNGLGFIKYTTFSWSERACVGFGQHFGSRPVDDAPNLGAHFVAGFYCTPRQEFLADEDIDAVLKSIRIRTKKGDGIDQITLRRL